MIGDEAFDNNILKYYLYNYFSSHGKSLDDIAELGMIRLAGEMNLFLILSNFSRTSNHSHQEASHTAGFLIAANMFSHPGAFLPPETVNPEYTLPLVVSEQLMSFIASERLKKNEGAIVTGGYLDGRICTIFNKKKGVRDPLIIFANPIYTVAKAMELDTAEIWDTFLPRTRGNGHDYFHNARLTSGLGAALLYNPQNPGRNIVYMLQESPQGEVGWGLLTKIQARYEPNMPDKRPMFPIEYTYTQYKLLTGEELKNKGIQHNSALCLPGAGDVYLVCLDYTMNTKRLPKSSLKLDSARAVDVRQIFQN